MRRLGRPPQPIRGSGRTLAQTFWGHAWCRNLEQYRDYANRLPRGRTYLRQGAVLDLSIDPGLVTAWVAGRGLYQVVVAIRPLSRKRWAALRQRCAGGLSSVVELLEGHLGDTVMEAVCEPQGGLFPEPRELEMSCSCPDWAQMCKHVAAALYGVGLRLDEQPQLLFELRGVDPDELVDLATPARVEVDASRRLEGDLSEIFGIQIAPGPVASPSTAERAPSPTAAATSGETTASNKQTSNKQTSTNKTSTKKKHPARSRAWLQRKTRAKKRVPKRRTANKKTASKKTANKKTAKTRTSTRNKTSTNKTSARRRVLDLVMTRQQLLARGVPASTIQSWLRRRVLRPKGRRGTYALTQEALDCLQWYGTAS